MENSKIYLCVNYKSIDTLQKSIDRWRKNEPEIEIFVVDNYSDDLERLKVESLSKECNFNLLISENIGYGAALDLGLNHILNSQYYSDESIVYFGNVDVYPTQPLRAEVSTGIPMLNIYDTRRLKNVNPFLTKFQYLFFFLAKMAAKYKSKYLLLAWLAIQKITSKIPSKPAAVHGALFCLNVGDLRTVCPIFNPNVFLYCEEMFFQQTLLLLNKPLIRSDNKFEHIGSVSTGSYFSNSSKRFENWCDSMAHLRES